MLNIIDRVRIMSVYSDWECGILTDKEYKQEENHRARKYGWYYYKERIDEYFGGDCFDGEDDEEDCWD